MCKNVSIKLILNSNDEFVCLKCEKKTNAEIKSSYFDFCPLREWENCNSCEKIENLIVHILKCHKNIVIDTDNFEYRITVDLSEKNTMFRLLMTKFHRFLLILAINDTQGLQYSIYAEKRNYNFVLKCGTTNFERIKSTIPLGKLYDNLQNDGNFNFTEKISVKQKNGIIELNFSILNNEYETIEKFISQNSECPVCNSSLKRPVYQCIKGHSVCCNCKMQLSNCPTCRSIICDTRNYLIENLISNLLYFCSYREKGCEEVEIGDKIIEHEAQCLFRTYFCPLDKKHREELSYDDILEHFQKFHADEFTTNLIYEKNISDFYVTSIVQRKYIFAYGLLFRFSYKFIYNEFLFSVELIGSHCCPEKFNYKISFSDSHYKFTQRIPCISEMEQSRFEERAFKISATKLYSLMPTLNRLPKAVFRVVLLKKQEL